MKENTSKVKGNLGEQKFTAFLQRNGIRAFWNTRSGATIAKGDVSNPIGNLEVKTCKKINLQEAWRQTLRDSNLSHADPYLAIHFDSMPEGEWLIVMHSEKWIELLLGLNEGDKIEATYENYKLKNALRFAIEANKKVIKILEEK